MYLIDQEFAFLHLLFTPNEKTNANIFKPHIDQLQQFIQYKANGLVRDCSLLKEGARKTKICWLQEFHFRGIGFVTGVFYNIPEVAMKLETTITIPHHGGYLLILLREV